VHEGHVRKRIRWRERSGIWLGRHRDQPAEDLPAGHPAVDPAAVVADLEALALDRFDQVQVLRAVRTTQHDVADLEHLLAQRLDRAELPVVDLAGHAVTARPKLNCLAQRETGDVSICPTHTDRLMLLAPKEGIEIYSGTNDDERLLHSQQLVSQWVPPPPDQFRRFGQSFGRALLHCAHVSRLFGSRSRRVVSPDGVTLPDGAAVTIAVNDERDAEVALSPADLAELDDAIAEADRSESVSSSVVLAELERIASSSKR
jgi:hypothetical protein